jgi:hypothetical protein
MQNPFVGVGVGKALTIHTMDESEYHLSDEWLLHFENDPTFQLVNGKALSAELKHSRMRSVAWLVFLDVVEGPPAVNEDNSNV